MLDVEPMLANRCVSCGFLAKINVDAKRWPVPGIWEIDATEREQGRAFSHIQDMTAGPRKTMLYCVRDVPLAKEFHKTLAKRGADPQPADQFAAAKDVIERDRDCDRWFGYTPGLSPLEHLQEFRAIELESRRVEFERAQERAHRAWLAEHEQRNQAWIAEQEAERRRHEEAREEDRRRYEEERASDTRKLQQSLRNVARTSLGIAGTGIAVAALIAFAVARLVNPAPNLQVSAPIVYVTPQPAPVVNLSPVFMVPTPQPAAALSLVDSE